MKTVVRINEARSASPTHPILFYHLQLQCPDPIQYFVHLEYFLPCLSMSVSVFHEVLVQVIERS